MRTHPPSVHRRVVFDTVMKCEDFESLLFPLRLACNPIAVTCLVIESIALIAVCIIRPLTNQIAYSLIYLVVIVFFSLAFLAMMWFNMWKVCACY